MGFLSEFKTVSPLVWWLLMGTGLTTLLNFSCLPYIAIILSKERITPLKKSYKNMFLKKGDELGIFKYGSAIILLFENNSIVFNTNIIKRNKVVNVCEGIAKKRIIFKY